MLMIEHVFERVLQHAVSQSGLINACYPLALQFGKTLYLFFLWSNPEGVEVSFYVLYPPKFKEVTVFLNNPVSFDI